MNKNDGFINFSYFCNIYRKIIIFKNIEQDER